MAEEKVFVKLKMPEGICSVNIAGSPVKVSADGVVECSHEQAAILREQFGAKDLPAADPQKKP
jgi:hypothetical protein